MNLSRFQWHIALFRVVLYVLFLSAVLAVVLAALGPTPLRVVPAPVVCTEDMPCWDCATMGNHNCAPRVLP